MDHLIQVTSPPKCYLQKNGALILTDWTVLKRPPDTPTVTLTWHQHTWWVALWDGRGTATRVQTCTPEPQTATPEELGDHFRNCADHTNHLLAHWLAVKTAMPSTMDAPATDTTLPTTWLTLDRNVAAYVRRHGMTQTQRWMSWPTDTEQTLKLRTSSLENQAKKDAGHAPTQGRPWTGI